MQRAGRWDGAWRAQFTVSSAGSRADDAVQEAKSRGSHGGECLEPSLATGGSVSHSNRDARGAEKQLAALLASSV